MIIDNITVFIYSINLNLTCRAVLPKKVLGKSTTVLLSHTILFFLNLLINPY